MGPQAPPRPPPPRERADSPAGLCKWGRRGGSSSRQTTKPRRTGTGLPDLSRQIVVLARCSSATVASEQAWGGPAFAIFVDSGVLRACVRRFLEPVGSPTRSGCECEALPPPPPPPPPSVGRSSPRSGSACAVVAQPARRTAVSEMDRLVSRSSMSLYIMFARDGCL